MEERVQEADTLASKIKELEDQLYKEKKECKRQWIIYMWLCHAAIVALF